MVLSETVTYITLLVVALAFSILALAIKDQGYRIILKIIAGLSWLVMSVTSIFFLGGSALLAVPMMLMFLGIGLVFFFTMVRDFYQEKKSRIWQFED